MAKRRKPINILDAINKEIDRQGVTVADLSERTGIQRPNIYPYLSGNKLMRVDTIERFMDALGMEVRAGR